MLAMILVWWPEFARLMRGQVLATKQNDYVTSASAGRRDLASPRRARDPERFPPIVVKATLDIGNAMVLIAALSFLGLGAVPPEPEWGAMIAAGRTSSSTGGSRRSRGWQSSRWCSASTFSATVSRTG